MLSNVSRIDEMLISDITGDGMEELILVIDNSTAGGKDVMALSGTGLQPLWISSVSHAAPLKYTSICFRFLLYAMALSSAPAQCLSSFL